MYYTSHLLVEQNVRMYGTKTTFMLLLSMMADGGDLHSLKLTVT